MDTENKTPTFTRADVLSAVVTMSAQIEERRHFSPIGDADAARMSIISAFINQSLAVSLATELTDARIFELCEQVEPLTVRLPRGVAAIARLVQAETAKKVFELLHAQCDDVTTANRQLFELGRRQHEDLALQQAELVSLRALGDNMASAFFNVSQQFGKTLSVRDCNIFKAMQVEWDAARRAPLPGATELAAAAPATSGAANG